MAMITEWITALALRNPRFLRDITEMLRRTGPVIQAGNTVLVLGYEGAREVFARPRDFLSGPVYAQKLKLGPLVLGMDDSSRYRVERELAVCELGQAQLVRHFECLVGCHAQRRLGSRLRSGPIDFVGEIVEPVFAGALCDVFGIRADAAQSNVLRTPPGERTLIEWMRKLGGAISSNVPGAFGLEGVAEAVAVELQSYLSSQLRVSSAPIVQAFRKVLGDDANVVRFVGGMLSASAGMFKLTTLAMQQLIERDKIKDLLAPGRHAAPVIEYVWEAARFDPPFPLLNRHCPRETTLAGRVVPAGATVWVSLLSAMFDPSAVDNPQEFCVPRPSHVYNVFGLGTHRCAGLDMASGGVRVLFEVFLELLCKSKLSVSGAGKVRYDGPAVARFVIQLKDSRAQLKVITNATANAHHHCPVCPRNAA